MITKSHYWTRSCWQL